MLTHAGSRRILLPSEHGTRLDHKAESATSAGVGHDLDEEAVAIFPLEVPQSTWSAVVTVLSGGPEESAACDLARSVAVGAFEDEVSRAARKFEFQSSSWQLSVTEGVTAAFAHAFDTTQRLLAAGRTSARPGVSLTAAMVLGDWLCVAEAGSGRVYRLSKRGLDCIAAVPETLPLLTTDDATPRSIGVRLAPWVPPPLAIRFLRMSTGDTVLVCSDLVGERLDSQTLMRLLAARRSTADVARNIVTAARGRNPSGDLTACVVRIGSVRGRRLPEPIVGRPPRPDGHALRSTRRATLAPMLGGVGRLAALLAMLALADGVVRGPLPAPAPAMAMVIMERPMAPTLAEDASALAAAPAPPALPEDAAALEAAPALPVRTVAAPVPARDANAPELARARTVRPARAPVVDTAVSVLPPAPMLPEPSSPSIAVPVLLPVGPTSMAPASLARTAPVPTARLAAASVSTDALRNERQTQEARRTLREWLGAVVSQSNARKASAPVLASEPSGFAAFVARAKPTLSDPVLRAITVNETTGQATAQWMATWRTAFGPERSRRMTATVAVVRMGDSWRVAEWRVSEGMP